MNGKKKPPLFGRGPVVERHPVIVTGECELHFAHPWIRACLCVALSFFDDHVSDETKTKMVGNLSVPSKGKAPKRVQVKEISASADLSDFVNQQTKNFFTILGVDPSFLNLPPSEWKTDPTYQRGLQTVRALEVVNDVAERAVRLTSDYNEAQLTKSEEGFQNLLLVMHKTLQNDSSSSLTLSHYVKTEVNKI
ncbi:Clustered mitochondria protein-like protein [Frankliniella fusca]|uniref:Clustered mitochondria protein-like protein n=1 Tax=Frankliniella fusca TaxID=407009 RepID=A0AAE1HYI1_9NEOP|nr:Clustered mitochondria protein-like protein [Frankliniella fusca]